VIGIVHNREDRERQPFLVQINKGYIKSPYILIISKVKDNPVEASAPPAKGLYGVD
jgi:hypothetical protein